MYSIPILCSQLLNCVWWFCYSSFTKKEWRVNYTHHHHERYYEHGSNRCGTSTQLQQSAALSTHQQRWVAWEMMEIKMWADWSTPSPTAAPSSQQRDDAWTIPSLVSVKIYCWQTMMLLPRVPWKKRAKVNSEFGFLSNLAEELVATSAIGSRRFCVACIWDITLYPETWVKIGS